MTGFLSLIIGPMFSGKTSKLINLYKNMEYYKSSVIVINYDKDTRYSDNMLSSHDKVMIPCKMVNKLSQISDICNNVITDEFNNSSVILINEGQFFEDIVSWVNTAVDIYNKKVYIAALDGDFKRNIFGDILQLIPNCDNVIKLNATCYICKQNNAIFSHRLSDDTTQTVIGSDTYIPLCRECSMV